MLFFPTLAAVALLCQQAVASPLAASWPNKPFNTKGNTIVDASGNSVLYIGTNWPGAADVMIPEGLQYSSISSIVSKIKSLGMNVVRLTYAIEMIDDIIDGGKDVTLKDAFNKALGTTNGTKVLSQVLAKNPSFSATTTRLQVFDAVAAECAKQQIYVHLDNHISSGQWCCSATDGNGWFGDTKFNVANWKRGLNYMATHAKSWTALTSMSLRNELRSPSNNNAVQATYNWSTWYTNVKAAADGIHQSNADTLIFLSGLNYDTTLQPVTAGSDLGNGKVFRLSDFSYRNKIVFELHNYSNDNNDCAGLQSFLYSAGFNAMDTSSSTTAKNIAPVVLTEFGFAQNQAESQRTYAQCLKDFVGKNNYGWMQWVIAGSYYIRTGTQDSDELWGMLNHDWSAWRSSDVINGYTIPMIQATKS